MRDTRASHRHRAAPRHRAQRKQPVPSLRIDQHFVPHTPHLPCVTDDLREPGRFQSGLADGALKRQPLPHRKGRVSECGHPDELCDPEHHQWE